MGSIAEDGNLLPLKSRSTWLITNKSRPEIFIANVFVHSIYWPSSAFKKSTYKSIYAPWHSASFPDTEILLRLCAVGEFVVIPKRTMFYRENSESESHSLTTIESKLGAALGFLRVFDSKEFKEILILCDPTLLSSFFSRLEQGIEFRIGNSEISKLIYVFALEKANMVYDYCNEIVIKKLSDFYQDMNATRTAVLLNNLLIKIDSQQEGYFQPVGNGNIDSSLSLQNSQSRSKTKLPKFIRTILIKMIRFLPVSFRIPVMKIILRLRIKLNSKHPWNFELKRND
jgi:hypothetical protein